MDSFSFSSAYVLNLKDLIFHFKWVKIRLEEKNQQNLIPFHDTYFLITQSVSSKIGTGFFENDETMRIFVISFARFYFDALDKYFRGETSSSAWQFMFNHSEKNHLPRFLYLLLGVHAHINQDLSVCIKELGFGDAFNKDYLAINEIIKGKLAVAITQLNEKSAFLKALLEHGFCCYQWPMHKIIVFCRNIAWYKSQISAESALAFA
ncbi:MAG: hypothetical protein RLZZ417_2545 [Bacteroidota bacterium]|jgi:hypothetical protein